MHPLRLVYFHIISHMCLVYNISDMFRNKTNKLINIAYDIKQNSNEFTTIR